jgi:hypothetical protein
MHGPQNTCITEALLDVSKETVIEENAHKTLYGYVSR